MEIKSRIQQKHDIESNWLKATNFIPKQGEIIVYDKDTTYTYERFKIGDGATKVNDLPFINFSEAERTKLAGIATGANKTVVDSSLSSTSTNPVQNKIVQSELQKKADKSELRRTWFVTIAGNENNYTSNKTFSEIQQAYIDGYTLIAICNNEIEDMSLTGIHLPLIGFMLNEMVMFAYSDAGNTIGIIIDANNIISVYYNVLTPDSIGALPIDTFIPTKISELTNDSNFTTTSALNEVKNTLNSHTENTTVHITSTERTNWNDANSKKHSHNNLSDLAKINSAAFQDESYFAKQKHLHSTSDVIIDSYAAEILNMPDGENLNTGLEEIVSKIDDVKDSSINSLSVNGKTITYTKGNGSTGSITTKDTTYSNATTAASGLMSTAMVSKLNGIETGANKYTHPNSGVTAGTYKSVTVNAQGHVTAGSNPTTLAGYGITDAEPKGTASSQVNSHNTSTSAHNDIRELISGLTTRLNTLANSDDTTLDQMSEIVAYIKNNKSLIEGVTNSKVNVADIIDNLTTNVSNKPLSAAQGVAIKTLIDDLESSLLSLNKDLSDHILDFDAHVSSTGHITSTERTNWNDANSKKHSHSNKSILDGHTASYTSEEKTKLAGIATGAEVNQNAFGNVKVGSTTVAADSKTDTIEFVGSNVTITPDATNDKITFGVANGTTATKGLVQLTDSTSSTSTTTAATPNAVKSAYDLANSANTKATNAQTAADSAKDNSITNLSVNGKVITFTKGNGSTASITTQDTTYNLGSFGVTSTAAELNVLDGITATTTELNYMDGVTSAVQTQLNSKAPTSHASSATSYGIGTGSNYGHVKLSDATTSTSAAASGVAATPKAVNDVKKLADAAQTAADSAADNSITGLSVSGKVITYTKGNGTTGTITTQDTNTTYSAAGSSLGLVKSGGDVSIADGIITISDDSHNHIIGNIDGLQSALDGKLGASDTATRATNADTATYATSAGSATNSSTASYATSANKATTASKAGTATYATNSGTATYATNAGTATYSSNGAKAASATSATYATTATNAGTATYATNAGTSNYAKNAPTYKGATTAAAGTKGLVPAATTATKDNFLRGDGTWAVPAKATSATSATYASTATNAGTATYATNSGTATYSSNGAKAASATSATYATTATNAGTSNYAKNAPTYKGATTAAAGTKGLVPAATTATKNNFLRGDGTWAVPSNAGTADYATKSGTATFASKSTTASYLVNGTTVAGANFYHNKGYGRLYASSSSFQVESYKTAFDTENRTLLCLYSTAAMASAIRLVRYNASTAATVYQMFGAHNGNGLASQSSAPSDTKYVWAW